MQEYVDISSLSDTARGLFCQTPAGHPNGLHLEPKDACDGAKPSQRAFWFEMFVFWMPCGRPVYVHNLVNQAEIPEK